ncbi:hypothetical protein [Paraburkholderia sp. BCC1885]|uniref:hypothetical protein n=1 Tax=Paraburkholderia sp. BCC1885 TaxID=2562669 RepID=UPI0028CB6C44|nr:hypothetical protein [Paraburkholderia sp. BCC1885]
MNHHDVEQELQHLEYVFAHISATDTVPPLSYWRNRLDSLRKKPIVPPQRVRISRLEEALGVLEVTSPGKAEAKPPAPVARTATRARR